MKIKIKEPLLDSRHIALLIFLSLLIFVPLFFIDRFAVAWNDVIWSGYSDLFVTVWSGGIVALFIAVIFFEIFRQTLRKIHMYICLSFLCIGLSETVYAFSSIYSHDAIWFRAYGVFIAGLILLVGLIEYRQHVEFSVPYLMRNLLICIALLIAFNFLPILSLDYLLKAYNNIGGLRLAYTIIFSLSSIFFLAFSVPWLNEYLKRWNRQDLVIGLFFVCFAQILFASRSIIIWSALWWLWHFGWLFIFLILCIYLLIYCLRKSLIWKLIVSVTLLFAFTIVISFWFVRKHYEKRDREMLINMLSAKLSTSRTRAFTELESSATVFKGVKKSLEELNISTQEELKKQINLFGKILCRKKSDNFVWISVDGETKISYAGRHLSNEIIKFILSEKEKSRNNELLFSIFKVRDFQEKGAKTFILIADNLKTGSSIDGYLCYCFEGTFLVKRSTPIKNSTEFGRIIFDTRKKKIIYDSFPSYLQKTDETVKCLNAILNSIAHKLRTSSRSENILEHIGKDEYVFFADVEPISGFLSMDYCRVGFYSDYSDHTSARVHIVASMSTMLVGVIIMLLLLHYQINTPLKKLIRAVTALQSGNFNIRINSDREDELALVENAFDQTAERLKILYRNLQENIKAKDNALETLRKVEKEKRDFFNALSHELKSPIHCILNFARFGLDSSINTTERDRYQAIHSRALELLQIVEELLQIARIESAPKREIAEFSIRELIRDLLSNYTALAQERKIKLRSVCEPETFDFNYMGDRNLIKIAISNLISNAIKFTDENTEVTVSCCREENSYLINVSDEGPGIPQNEIQNLFKEFSYIPGMKKHGTGLGLYISRKIVESEGGMIYAANNPKKGISFFIRLPVPGNEKK